MFRILRTPTIAALLALPLLLSSVPAQAEIVPPRTAELRVLGPGSGSGLIFADALQQASGWLSTTGTPLKLDPEGNLEALLPGQGAERVVFTTEHYPAGDYTLLFAGNGHFEVSGGTLSAGGGPGRLIVHVAPNDGAGLRLRLTAMDEANPVRNVRLILPGLEQIAAEQPLLPAFVRSLQGANVIRFSEWMRAGTFAESATSLLRPRVLRPTQAAANGAALEYMTLLANLTGANPWFSVPVGATDGYVRSMAAGIRRTLDPTLHPVVQYDNVNLFRTGSATNSYALMAARNSHISGDPETMVRIWYARRSAQILAIFRSEFEPGRVISADSPNVLRLNRVAPNPNARLRLATDASPFVAIHKPFIKPTYRPNAAQPLAAKIRLDLGGRAGVAIGLGGPLPDADLRREGARLPVASTRGGGFSIVAPADATERVLRIYTDVDRAATHLTATLEGKSYASQPLRDDVSSRSGVYTIVYRASHAGEHLVVTASRDAGASFAVRAATVATHDLKGSPNTAKTSEAVYHNDLLRTGWNPNETTLTTSNVGSSAFGQVGTLAVDGGVLAQPLYLANYNLPGQGKHNIVVVATENASVYEFDADTGAQLNFVSLGQAATYQDIGCGDIRPVYGVTSTPAIDTKTGTIYVVSTEEPTKDNFQVTLHALDIGTLTDKTTPVNLAASVVLSNGSTISFNPQYEYSRTSLVWNNNSLYVGIGSHCDNDAGAIVGWIMQYNSSLTQVAALPTIEDSAGYLLSSIWMSGFAPAVDESGDLFAVTGNGAFDGVLDYGESVIHVRKDLSKVSDYFTPHNWANLNGGDTDFGAGGVMLLPKQTSGKYKQLAVAMGKSSILYLLNRSKLGHIHTGDTGALQIINDSGSGVWGGPAYYSGPTGQFVYYQTGGDTLHAYELSVSPSGTPSLTLSSSGSNDAGYGGCTPVISSNGQVPGTAIVWDVERGNGKIYLEAYDASSLGTPLYSTQAGTWPQSNGFVTPLVAGGKVYVPAQGTVNVYGLSGSGS